MNDSRYWEKELISFSSDPDRYYKVPLFDKVGFIRQVCSSGKDFWSIVNRSSCPTKSYGFKIILNRRLDYVHAWKEIEAYFRSKNHAIISRYPVVCRWRDDLYFTIGSIVDFQRVMGGKVVFDFRQTH